MLIVYHTGTVGLYILELVIPSIQHADPSPMPSYRRCRHWADVVPEGPDKQVSYSQK